MCWTTSYPPELKVAQEDITSYKIVKLNPNNGTYNSIYYPFNYIPDILEEGKLELEENSWGGEIRVAFHSYDEKPIFHFGQFNIYTKHPKVFVRFSLESVLHGNYVVVRCIIPKNAEYYINRSGEIASNKIILTRKYWYVLD